MHRIVFLERNTFKAPFRAPHFEHEWIDHAETTSDQIVERLRHATIVIGNKLPLRASVLQQLPQLKLIAVAATGVDNIDLDYCRAHDIGVCNVRNYASHSLPEHVLLLMLALRRNITAYLDEVNNGQWQQAKQFCLLDHPIHDLHATTLGIIGFGFLGRAVKELAEAVGMTVIVAEHKTASSVRPGRVAFTELLRTSDAVSLHCPLNEETRNLIDRHELQTMKSTALLINTARGGLVHEQALLEALRAGSLAGAAFDVLSEEPPVHGNPLLEERLPNLIVTPHIAWASWEAMQTLADELVDNLEAFVRGERQNRVV